MRRIPTVAAPAALAFALAACLSGGGGAPAPGCKPTGTSGCTSSIDCCSYGCVTGTCVPNASEGGGCKTTPDCAPGMICANYACSSTATCRTTGDVCASDTACCSGNCAGASGCQPNTAPVASAGSDQSPLYLRTVTLDGTGSHDADGDALTYAWTLEARPAGSQATLAGAAGTRPTFYADVAGDYLAKLVVWDGNPATQPGRLSAQDTVTIHATDAPPVADAGPDATGAAIGQRASRNVGFTQIGSATDPDGDRRDCAWSAVEPDGASVALAAAAQCDGSAPLTFTCDLEGDWIVKLTVSDARASVSDTAVVRCANDPPVAAAGPAQVWNLGAAPPADNPTVTLAGSFTDRNGDAASAWAWTFDSVPAGSARTSASITNATGTGPLPQGAIPAATFQPDVAGRYVLRLHVEDRVGSFGESTLTVDVDRHVAPLGHDVVDAAHARGANALVIAGTDPSDAARGALWTYDLATGAETSVPVADALGAAGPPVAVAVTDDGATAIYAERGVVWKVTLGATPSAVRVPGLATFTPAADVGDVAVAGTKHAMAFPATGTAPFLVFDMSNNVDPALYAGRHGSPGPVPSDPSLFVSNPSSGRLDRYSILNGRQYPWSASGTSWCEGRTFAAADGSCVVNWCGVVFGTTGSGAGGLALVQTLSFQVAHLDSLANGQVVAVDTGATAIRRFTSGGGGLAALAGAAATDPLPRWGFGEVAYTPIAPFAFLAADGGRIAIVRVDTAPARFGVVRFP